jgi:hypothetical protein
MQEGDDLREKKDLKGALARYQGANDIMHVPTTALAVAEMHLALGQLVEARDSIAAIRLMMKKPTDPEPLNKARLKADQLDASLEGRIPSVTLVLRNAPAGATPVVKIDGVQLPASVVGLPRRVNPGHHVAAVVAGGATGQQEFDVREGESREVPIALVAGPSVADTPAAPTQTVSQPQPKDTSEPPAPKGGSRAVEYAGFGLAVVGLVAGGVTGFISMQKTSALGSECSAAHHCGPAAYSDYDTATTMATVSTISFIAAGVGAAVGVIGIFIAKPSEEPRAAGSSTSHVVPWIGPGSAGVRGTF